jgi:hypothetical protein
MYIQIPVGIVYIHCEGNEYRTVRNMFCCFWKKYVHEKLQYTVKNQLITCSRCYAPVWQVKVTCVNRKLRMCVRYVLDESKPAIMRKDGDR